MHKPTTAQIHQALDDLDEGKPISADMRVAVNQYMRLRAEAHLEQAENADTVWKQGAKGRASALREEWLILNNKCLSKGLPVCPANPHRAQCASRLQLGSVCHQLLDAIRIVQKALYRFNINASNGGQLLCGVHVVAMMGECILDGLGYLRFHHCRGLHADTPSTRLISATGHARRPCTRIGRSGPFSRHAHTLAVCSFRLRCRHITLVETCVLVSKCRGTKSAGSAAGLLVSACISDS